ncbi:DNA helicase UvrB [Enterococcus faecium]|uniref:Uncharacterized protein n=1 Tax=Enterococcus faecium TaxID=1352 RepID=A0A242AED0_ENTFC|nr:DNA helicase UvrB [Enterococcus faecium]OTN79388.1 hypothetical protein A5810_003246 [Enterococcus faecium]
MMVFRLDFGTKDAVFAISIFIIIGLSIVFKWTAWEFIISSIALIMAFCAGTMKQDKRILEQQSKK